MRSLPSPLGQETDLPRTAAPFPKSAFDGEGNAHPREPKLRAVICTRYGPPEVLRLEDVAEPAPKGNELRIRVSATAVTSSDCYLRGLNLNPAYKLMAQL